MPIYLAIPALVIVAAVAAVGSWLWTRTRVEKTCDIDLARVVTERDNAKKELAAAVTARDKAVGELQYMKEMAENANRLPEVDPKFDTARFFREVTGQFPVNPAPDLSFTGSWTRADAQKARADAEAAK